MLGTRASWLYKRDVHDTTNRSSRVRAQTYEIHWKYTKPDELDAHKEESETMEQMYVT